MRDHAQEDERKDSGDKTDSGKLPWAIFIGHVTDKRCHKEKYNNGKKD